MPTLTSRNIKLTMTQKKKLTALLLVLGMSTLSSAATAKESQNAIEELTQAYNDAQFCAALLNRLGGDENIKKSKLALAHSKTLAPKIGHATEAEFNQSYSDVAAIIATASAEETAQFSELCLAAW